jgi:hypothetical protein
MTRESTSRAVRRVDTWAHLDEVVFAFPRVSWQLPVTPESRLEELG